MSQATVIQIVLAAAIVGAAWLLGGWLASLLSAALERAGLDLRARRLVVRLVHPVAVVVGFIAALQTLAIDLTPVTAMLGAATLAIGFSLQGSLSNVASGALLWTLRPYTEGEVVTAGGHTGTVVDQGAFAVLLERPDGVMVTIPNNLVFSGPMQNFTRKGRRRVEVSVLLDHRADVARALAALTEALAASGGLEEPPPAALVLGVEERGIRVAARLWVASPDFGRATSDLTTASLGALHRAEVPLATMVWGPTA